MRKWIILQITLHYFQCRISALSSARADFCMSILKTGAYVFYHIFKYSAVLVPNQPMFEEKVVFIIFKGR